MESHHSIFCLRLDLAASRLPVWVAWVAFLLVTEAAHEGAHCVIWGHL